VVALAVVPGAAWAQPAGGDVPDVSGFADVTGDFIVHGPVRPGTPPGVHFTTADGAGCAFTLPFNPATPADGRVTCSGSLPGIADIPLNSSSPLNGACDWGIAAADLERPGQVNHSKSAGYTKALGYHREGCTTEVGTKVLGVGQKVTSGVVTCGTADGDVTVCTVGSHGFVLQPSGSFGF